MNDNLQDIEKLVGKYIDGTASIKEIAAIHTWLSESEANKVAFTKLKQECKQKQQSVANADWFKFEQKYGNAVKPSKKGKHLLGFISIAASISLVVGVSIHLMSNIKDNYSAVLAEASAAEVPEKTTINLSDGEQITLETSHSVVEIDEQGKQILLEDERVVEASGDTKSSKPGINQIIVPYGKTAELLLADGTKVWLNAGSRFVFPDHFNKQPNREVVLIGEAFFDVSHNADQPFKVITDEMVYTVLGTSFNIQSLPNSASVSAVLVEGSLQVEKKTLLNKQKVILKPGQKSQFLPKQDRMHVTNVNTAFYTSWKDGYLMLDKNRLGKLIKQIEQFYHSELVISNELIDMPTQLSGKLLLDEDPEQVYSALCDLTGMTYRIVANKVVFEKQ